MSHLSMGAINKTTNLYEYPKIAQKTNKYMCPECNRDLILKKGTQKVHHFAHYASNTPCMYYDRPSESQIHKDAKLALKTVLNNRTDISFIRTCNHCNNVITVDMNAYTEDMNIIVEYPFKYNDKQQYADLAIINNGQIGYIFEICYRHKTSPDRRPEPWVEIDAESFIKLINKNDTNSDGLFVDCIRKQECDECIEKEREERRRYEIERKIKEEKEQYRIDQKRKFEEYHKHRQMKQDEILKKVREETKRCIKCKSFERCKKCSEGVWAKVRKIISDEFDAINLSP